MVRCLQQRSVSNLFFYIENDFWRKSLLTFVVSWEYLAQDARVAVIKLLENLRNSDNETSKLGQQIAKSDVLFERFQSCMSH